MKIAVLGLRGMPDVMGGIETHCEQLYPRMLKLAPELNITVLARSPYVPKGTISYKGITVRPIFAVKHVYFETIAHTFLGLLYARFSVRADVVHIHAIGPGLLIPLAKLLGLSVVFTHHGEDYRRDKWNGVAKQALRMGEHMAARFSDRMISVSRPVARSLAVRNPKLADRIRPIPNGASVTSDLPHDREAADAALERIGVSRGNYAMTVARLVPEKGIHDLLDAVSDLPGDMKLVVVGGAQLQNSYSDSLLARAGDRIIFTGELLRSEIMPLYRNTALFVLASYHEGLPIAALEALALGARVLLSDIEANRDLELPATNYYPVGNVEALRAKLEAIGSIPAGNADVILSRYDWNVVAKETADVFREMSKSRASFEDADLKTAGGGSR